MFSSVTTSSHWSKRSVCYHYLRLGGYVFTCVCLSVCLPDCLSVCLYVCMSVNTVTQKLLITSLWIFYEMVGHNLWTNGLDFQSRVLN